MKAPKTGPEKGSLPGVLGVKRVGGVPTAFPADQVPPGEDLLQVVYDCGPVDVQASRDAAGSRDAACLAHAAAWR